MNAEVSRPDSTVMPDSADPVPGSVGEPAQWLPLPDVAELLKIPVNRVHQLIRDRKLVAVRRGGFMQVPAQLIGDGVVVKHVSGVLTLLDDARFDDEEIIRWLFTADDSLPGTPAQALAENRGTEIKRRAQALGF
ncbi:Rv2175c family DNA-binding protein [Fodinicola feengrottensis]|uniref:Rv2175c family DNA-binding protein n=2 Tax=Fodinicola feengrottensis TaxID=435914 RepID=A0ABN2HT37_9ACTN